MEKEVGFHILDIPIHILSEIMFNLSALSIVRCSSVCTKFRTILSDSSFQQSYFSRAPISFVLLSDHHRLTCIDSSSNQIQSFPNSNHGSSCIAMQLQPSSSTKRRTRTGTGTIHTSKQQSVINNRKRKRNINMSRFVTFHIHRRMNLINSSNGLLCLRASNYHSHSLYYISNPLLGEVLTIPPAPSPADHNLRFSAFGFDPKKKIFKILQLVSKSNRMVAELYQSDSHDNTWTLIPNAPSATAKFNSSSFDPCLNGALHWITDHDQISELICSFDLNTNNFKSLPPPPHFNAEYLSKISGVSIGVLKGCLCLCYVVDGAQFETWVMDKYGVKESWRKAFSIDINSYCGLCPQDKHRPIGFNSFGDMWLRADSDSHSYSQCLVSFSPETGVFRHIDIGGISSRNIQATPQVLSYVSMKEMINLGNNTHLQFQTIRPDKNNDLGFNLLTMGHFR